MKQRTVYMDNNATTPLHPEVASYMHENLNLFGNPSSIHDPGREAKKRVDEARENTARLIGAEPGEIVFTGCGSEANNTVLKQFMDRETARKWKEQGRDELIVSKIEHPCVLETAQYLADTGVTVHFLNVEKSGKIVWDEFLERLSEKTALVSVMYGNNEIGTLQDIVKITETAKKAGALVHTDAVQAVGKIPVDVKRLQVDYLTLSGHKLYGPKGIGALYVRTGAPVTPLVHGGHQEEGRRAGTHNTLGILGLGKAAELALSEMEESSARLWKLRNRLRDGIVSALPDISVNGHETDCLPGTLDVSFLGAEGESILLYLDFEGIYVSTGSACATGSLDPSHVLLSIGLDHEFAHGSIRFSLGRANTEEDVDYVLEKLPPIITKIRKISTLAVGLEVLFVVQNVFRVHKVFFNGIRVHPAEFVAHSAPPA
jgi:cysteine desulfurase